MGRFARSCLLMSICQQSTLLDQMVNTGPDSWPSTVGLPPLSLASPSLCLHNAATSPATHLPAFHLTLTIACSQFKASSLVPSLGNSVPSSGEEQPDIWSKSTWYGPIRHQSACHSQKHFNATCLKN